MSSAVNGVVLLNRNGIVHCQRTDGQVQAQADPVVGNYFGRAEVKRISVDKLVSATLGDVPYKPGTVSLAAMGAHVSGADYIKVGL